MNTVHGMRNVGDVMMPVDELPGAVLFNTFVTCDSFIMPAHQVPGLAPGGAEVRVQERGWGYCPCCSTQQPQVRGGGVGVIECHASGKFNVYVSEPHHPALSPSAPDET